VFVLWKIVNAAAARDSGTLVFMKCTSCVLGVILSRVEPLDPELWQMFIGYRSVICKSPRRV